MKTGLIFLLLTVFVSVFTTGCKTKEKKVIDNCKNDFKNSGERAGCMLGAYSELHKLKKSCDILVSCAVKYDHSICLKKRIKVIIKELSQRSSSRTYVRFSDQLMAHMDNISKIHPINMVNACRHGRTLISPEKYNPQPKIEMVTSSVVTYHH